MNETPTSAGWPTSTARSRRSKRLAFRSWTAAFCTAIRCTKCFARTRACRCSATSISTGWRIRPGSCTMTISQSREEMLDEMRRTAAAAERAARARTFTCGGTSRGARVRSTWCRRPICGAAYVIIVKEVPQVESGVLFARHAAGRDARAAESGRGAEPRHQERQLSQQHSGRGGSGGARGRRLPDAQPGRHA